MTKIIACIGLKHFVKRAKNLSDNDKKTYVYQLAEGFRNCQSRQGMELNNVLTKMGALNTPIGSNLEKIVYEIINEIKLDTYNNMLNADGGVAVHKVARYFTVVKNQFGLPASINFNEKISKITDADIEEIMGEYVKKFNDKSIVKMFVEKISKITAAKNSDINNYALRNKMLESLNDLSNVNPATKLNYIRGEEFSSYNAPLNEKEARYFLEIMGILKTKYHKDVRAKLEENSPTSTTQTATSISNS